MIDTIVLRIHNIKDPRHNHFHIAEFLDKPTSNGVSSWRKVVNVEEIEKLPNTVRYDYIKYFDTGKERAYRHRNKLNVDSSHYLCTYLIDRDADFIEFNFSIPKYLNGHNVSQFIPEAYGTKDFSMAYSNDFQNARTKLYGYLIKFLHSFFKKTFGTLEYDLKYIEINRVDLCFNQIFRTKEEALQYFEYQTRITKKNVRKTSDLMNSLQWDTTISFKSKPYSFKIYHKGTEFSKNDARKLQMLNSELKTQEFDIMYLQNYADRILRYEATFRPRYLSNIYRRKIFRRKSKEYKEDMKLYKKLHSLTRGGTRYTIPVDKNGNEVKANTRGNLNDKKIFKHKQLLTKSDKTFYRTFSKHLKRTNRFYMDIDHKTRINATEHSYDLRTLTWTNSAKFSEMLLAYLVDDFKKMCDEFIIKNLDDISSIYKKIDLYNTNLKRKKDNLKFLNPAILSKEEKADLKKPLLNQKRLVVFYEMIQKYGSIDILKKKCRYEDRTFYRLKADMKAIGVENTMATQFALDINVPFDYTRYNYELMNNMNRILKSYSF